MHHIRHGNFINSNDRGQMIDEFWLHYFHLLFDSNGPVVASSDFVLDWSIIFFLTSALYVAVSNCCINMT